MKLDMKLDKQGHPYLTWVYLDLTHEERISHFQDVGKRLLKHKFNYYVSNIHSIEDSEYDYVERYYEAVAEDLGLEPEIVNMVGFNPNHPWSMELLQL